MMFLDVFIPVVFPSTDIRITTRKDVHMSAINDIAGIYLPAAIEGTRRYMVHRYQISRSSTLDYPSPTLKDAHHYTIMQETIGTICELSVQFIEFSDNVKRIQPTNMCVLL